MPIQKISLTSHLNHDRSLSNELLAGGDGETFDKHFSGCLKEVTQQERRLSQMRHGARHALAHVENGDANTRFVGNAVEGNRCQEAGIASFFLENAGNGMRVGKEDQFDY